MAVRWRFSWLDGLKDRAAGLVGIARMPVLASTRTSLMSAGIFYGVANLSASASFMKSRDRRGVARVISFGVSVGVASPAEFSVINRQGQQPGEHL
jgi:hypothetical protein